MRIQLVEQDPALLGALKEACQNDYFHSEACSKMRGLEDTIGRVATTDSTVLIVGETGTGKELAARQVHRISVRSDKPIVTVNCAAIPETLIESELFGYEKGAFTGATANRLGLIEAADGGTLFSMKLVNCRSPLRLDCCDLFKKARSAELAPSPAKTSTSV